MASTLQPILDIYDELTAEIEKGAALVRAGVNSLNEDQLEAVREHLEAVREKSETAIEAIGDHLDGFDEDDDPKVETEHPGVVRMHTSLADKMRAFADELDTEDLDRTETKFTGTDGTTHTLTGRSTAAVKADLSKPAEATEEVPPPTPVQTLGDAFGAVNTLPSQNSQGPSVVGSQVDANHETSADALADKAHATETVTLTGQNVLPSDPVS
jgi:hypothetical protein